MLSGTDAQAVTIRSQGALLSGMLLRPQGPAVAAVVLHGATGVPMGFYRAFAEWLAAERRCAVLIYDYRDFGASRRGPLRASRATLLDWGLHDQAAALRHLAKTFPDLPLRVVGHSLGGLFLAHHPGMERVERVVTVGSGLIHVSDHPFSFRMKARAFWHLMPPVVALLGHAPGRALGFGVDLPAGVYADWRRWCLTPGFHLSETGRRLPAPEPQRVTAAMRVVAVADDLWVPQAAVWRLMALYPAAVKRQAVIVPEAGAIGHLGLFRRSSAAFWPGLADA
jgi:predicted alpha/beta hydrolase